MDHQKQRLYNVIEELPEELSNKVIDYVEYLKFSYIISNAPKELIIKDKENLKKKNILENEKELLLHTIEDTQYQITTSEEIVNLILSLKVKERNKNAKK